MKSYQRTLWFRFLLKLKMKLLLFNSVKIIRNSLNLNRRGRLEIRRNYSDVTTQFIVCTKRDNYYLFSSFYNVSIYLFEKVCRQ